MSVISLRAIGEGGALWWVCPYVEVRGKTSDGDDPVHGVAVPDIRILNPFRDGPAKVLVLFWGPGGRYEPFTGQLSVPAQSMRDHRPAGAGQDFAGWVSVTSDRPVMVSGIQATERKTDPVSGTHSNYWERVPLTFFPATPSDD